MNEPYAYLLIKAILTLFFVLGIAGAALLAVRRFSGCRLALPGKKAQSPVRVLSTTFMGPKRNLALVEVAGEILVLGLTPSSINFLARIDNREAAEEIRKFASSRQKPLLNLFQGGA